MTNQSLPKTFFPALFAAVMLCSASSTFAQVKIGTNPTTINPANNLEVEAATAGRKTSIDKTTGQMTIKDGTEGSMKVLTSDANGAASWQTLRTTAITSFPQVLPGISMDFPFYAGTCAYSLGNPPPACAIDINQDGSFAIARPVNDVIIDMVDIVSVTNNTSTIYFSLAVFMDKTTPGVFEYIGGDFITYANIGCGTATANGKIALKNLPVRANYNLKTYMIPWVNFGAVARIGIGAESLPGCGTNSSAGNLIVSVSQ
ncbi:hypothetical protein [Dyadobacter diqingensis]|uniref:hypothetical protein n=1 Tax=Dyadobacter diqingensis TaxID=2938121 RepID=UPI0020C1ACDE|nr:hypothetical protein [Dyadobacter diqingensis]